VRIDLVAEGDTSGVPRLLQPLTRRLKSRGSAHRQAKLRRNLEGPPAG
jgi:hypothetical protein